MGVARCRWCVMGAWLLLVTEAEAKQVAFVLPPASQMVAMLPVAQGCIDAGHDVTILGWDTTVAKLRPVFPRASFIELGAEQRPAITERSMAFIFGLPYKLMPFFGAFVITLGLDNLWGAPLAMAVLPHLKRLRPDVVCTSSNLASVYGAAEAAGVPAVGIAFGPLLYASVLDPPWSTEPVLGSWYSREELAGNPAFAACNIAARVFGCILRVVALVPHNLRRFRMGLTALQSDIFESMWVSPLIVPSLPELSGGYAAAAVGPHTVMAGMYDHPALEGVSMKQSTQHVEIMSWLDGKKRDGVDVVYTAFGSEVILDRGRFDKFMQAFADGNITVLWALKKAPEDFTAPANVFITGWAPQKLVLAHPSVKVFVSHGGGNSVREALAAGTPMLIMPVMGDCATVAMMHEKLGVALRLSKHDITSDAVIGGVAKLTSVSVQARARSLQEFNQKHASLDRAVEVVENAASLTFPQAVPTGQGGIPALMSVAVLWIAVATCARCGRIATRCCRGVASRENRRKSKDE